MTHYVEEQKLSYLGVFLTLIYLFISLFMFLVPSTGEEREIMLAFIIQSVVFIPMIWIAFTAILRTEVGHSYIQFQFSPFAKKRRYDASQIQEVKVIKYGFVGGWGIRLFTRYGTVYNTWGNKGLFIKFNSGKKMVVGTQKAEELRQFLISSTTFGE